MAMAAAACGKFNFLVAGDDQSADDTPADLDALTAKKALATFAEVSTSLRSLGAREEEVHEAWATIAAVLALGELVFDEEVEDDTAANSANEGKATLPDSNDAALEAAAAARE